MRSSAASPRLALTKQTETAKSLAEDIAPITEEPSPVEAEDEEVLEASNKDNEEVLLMIVAASRTKSDSAAADDDGVAGAAGSARLETTCPRTHRNRRTTD